MATFNINTPGVTYFDTLSGKTGGDTYNISLGATLNIDCDLRLSSNGGATQGPFAIITIASTGGELVIDGRFCRLIPFNNGSDTVPAYGTTISQGAVTGRFAGVFTAINNTPVAPGESMPSSGFIRVTRVKTGDVDGGNYSSGALTGISATSTGTSTMGFIEVCGVQNSTSLITIPRLGRLTIEGDWFELGTTTGVRGQVVNLPTLGQSAMWLPGVWIETGPGTNVYEFFSACNVLTTGSTPAAAATGNWFTTELSTDGRNRIVQGIAGGFRIGSDGTNNIGMLPPEGCRIRIPNVILTNCLTSSRNTTAYPSNTIANNVSTQTTGAGVLSIQKCIGNWYFIANQAFAITIKDSAFGNILNISECASSMYLENVHVGVINNLASASLILNQNYAGGTFVNCSFTRGGPIGSASHSVTISSCIDLVFDKCRFQLAGNRNNNTIAYGCSITTSGKISFNECISTTGFSVSSSSNCFFKDTLTYDRPVGSTNTTNPAYGITISANSTGILVDGWSFFGTNNHPYYALISITNSSDVKVRNIGTATNPLNMGSANPSRLFILSGGGNRNIQIKRCWAINYQHVFIGSSTGSTAAPPNNDTIFIIENCGSKATLQDIATLNCLAKGCRWTGPTAGQVSCYGTHFMDYFESATLGYIGVRMNEKTEWIYSVDAYSVLSGNPRFTSSGTISMPNLGDEIEWTFPYYALGHDSFNTTTLPKLIAVNPANFVIDYKVDINDGNGFSNSWERAIYRIASLAGSTGTTVKVTSTANVQVGNLILGTNIPADTTVASIINSTDLQISQSVTGAVSGDVTFTGLNLAPAFNSSLGFKMKIKVKTVTANNNNAITQIFLPTVTSTISQSYLYPLDTASLELTGLNVGTEVRCYLGTDPATAIELGGTENSGTSFVLNHSVGGQSGYIVLISLSYQNIRLPITYSTSNMTIPIQQIVDRNYHNPG